MHRPSRFTLLAVMCVSALVFPGRLMAVDGVIEVNQARALAGGVSPGDAPGFPVTISVSGSYRLTGSLDVTGQPTPQNVTAIEILSSAKDVTVDLNGFAVVGPLSCSGNPNTCTPSSGAGDGIANLSAGSNSVTVRNGTVRGMGRIGIAIGAQSCLVENVHVLSNGTDGIYLLGGIVRNSVASYNHAFGIVTDANSLVVNTLADWNGSAGISIEAGTLTGNTASNNTGDGLVIRDSPGLASYNTAFANGARALFLVSGNDGYVGNVLSGTSPITGGISLGLNLCNGAVCP